MAVDMKNVYKTMTGIQKQYEEGQRQAYLAQEQQAAAEKEAKDRAEANKYIEMGKLSSAQEGNIEALRKQAAGENSYSMAMAQKMQSQAARQQMAMAYARGYNPGAVRGAQMAAADAQSQIAAEAQQARIQEQAQAQAQYSQALEYKQKMAMAAQEAANAYMSGKFQEAAQLKKMAQDYELGIKSIEEQRRAREQEESSWWKKAIVGGVLQAGSAYAGGVAAKG